MAIHDMQSFEFMKILQAMQLCKNDSDSIPLITSQHYFLPEGWMILFTHEASRFKWGSFKMYVTVISDPAWLKIKEGGRTSVEQASIHLSQLRILALGLDARRLQHPSC